MLPHAAEAVPQILQAIIEVRKVLRNRFQLLGIGSDAFQRIQSGAQTVQDGGIFFKQHGIGSFDAFIYFLAVLQYRDLIGKRFVFAWGGVSLIDLVDLETIKISFARVFFL